MTNLRIIKYFPGIQVKQYGKEIHISQEKSIEESLKKFGIKNCNPIFSLMAKIWSLLRQAALCR